MRQIKRVLVDKPELKELYDKQEIYIRKPFENTPL